MFKALYTNSSCSVKTETGETDLFTILLGVQQDCILSPFFDNESNRHTRSWYKMA